MTFLSEMLGPAVPWPFISTLPDIFAACTTPGKKGRIFWILLVLPEVVTFAFLP